MYSKYMKIMTSFMNSPLCTQDSEWYTASVASINTPDNQGRGQHSTLQEPFPCTRSSSPSRCCGSGSRDQAHPCVGARDGHVDGVVDGDVGFVDEIVSASNSMRSCLCS